MMGLFFLIYLLELGMDWTGNWELGRDWNVTGFVIGLDYIYKCSRTKGRQRDDDDSHFF